MQSYRANLFLVILTFLLPGVFFAKIAVNFYFKKPSLSGVELFFLSLLFVAWLVAMTYLAVLRIELGADSIVYRNLFRGRHIVQRNELSSVFHESRQTGDGPMYVLIVTPRLASRKPPIKIPLFLLSLRAGTELPAALAAKNRDSEDLLTLT
jgi:Zn-dependent protease with chaperone function